ARAFAPLATGALGVAALTGVLAAVREVHRWYFLEWSAYGRVVLVKTGLVALAAGVGGVTAWRARRGDGERARAGRTVHVGVAWTGRGAHGLRIVRAGVARTGRGAHAMHIV